MFNPIQVRVSVFRYFVVHGPSQQGRAGSLPGHLAQTRGCTKPLSCLWSPATRLSLGDLLPVPRDTKTRLAARRWLLLLNKARCSTAAATHQQQWGEGRKMPSAKCHTPSDPLPPARSFWLPVHFVGLWCSCALGRTWPPSRFWISTAREQRQPAEPMSFPSSRPVTCHPPNIDAGSQGTLPFAARLQCVDTGQCSVAVTPTFCSTVVALSDLCVLDWPCVLLAGARLPLPCLPVCLRPS